MEYYKKYYINNIEKIVGSIRKIESREIAYIDFDGIMYRHIALSKGDFGEWLISQLPRDLYHSSSYYLFPDRPIEDKVWRGGDLIFDIDLDHIPTYTPNFIWLCNKCNAVFKKEASICEQCNSKTRKIHVPRMNDLEIAKKETFRLLDAIYKIMALPVDETQIYFSGARGYHVHIYSDVLTTIDTRTRIEIKDFITLDGFDIANMHYLNRTYIERIIGDIQKQRKEIYQYFNNSDINLVLSLYRSMNKIKMFREKLQRNRRLRNKINNYVREIYGIHIDGVVTTDISRLIRAPYSIHGKTGLIKKSVEYDSLDGFMPYRDAALYNEEVLVKVLYLPNIIWGEKEYEEAYDVEMKLPLSLAIFLVNRGLAYDTRRV